MNKITGFLQQASRMFAVLLLGAVLFLTTACNNGNELGARPNNPPVQMGGSNNPHKRGGDGYTEYKAAPAPTVKRASDRASLPIGVLIAAARVESNANDLLYPGPDVTASDHPTIGPVNPKDGGRLTDPQQIPAVRQPVIDRSDPDAKILEKTGQAFKDATNFLKDTADSASQYPEMKANPGIEK